MNEDNAFSMDFDGNVQWPFNARQSDSLSGDKTINIYSAGPLTNIDPHIEKECQQVRDILKRSFEGYDYEGVTFHIYDPAENTMPGSNHSADDVYAINYEQCVTADLIAYHVTTPSLGVGCESQISADATVPRVVIARAEASVSRMFEGVFSTTIQTIRFENEHDLELQLINHRPQIAKEVLSSAKIRRPLLKDFADLDLGLTIFRQRIIGNVTVADLARQTDCKEEWLQRLERNPILAACCSAMQLNRIANATDCNLQTLGPNLTTLRPKPDGLEEDQKESLDNLVNYVLAKDRWVEDRRVFRLWNEYVDECQHESMEAVEYREGGSIKVSTEEWRRRDSASGLLF